MHTVYRVKRMENLDGSTNHAVFVGDFDEQRKDEYIKDHAGVYVVETIVVSE